MATKCVCGFEFSGPGEFRNCPAFVTWDGKEGVICPTCGNAYIEGILVNQGQEPESPETSQEDGDGG